MKLTKKLVFKIGYELWDWLAKNPVRTKRFWPGWEKYGEMRNNCPCCEYSVKYGAEYCRDNCLGKSIWKTGHCGDPSSPYKKWYDSSSTITDRKYARIIANGFKRLLRNEK